jgi:hypothetical protein
MKKPSTTLHGTGEKIISSAVPSEPDKAQMLSKEPNPFTRNSALKILYRRER